MASTEVDLIRQLTRTLRKVWLVTGTGDAFSTGQGSDMGEDVRAARRRGVFQGPQHPRGRRRGRVTLSNDDAVVD
jgi:hypothetical protein